MGCYHFHLNQLSRGHGQSAVASAAYRAGEKLYSTYYGETNDYTRKGGVVLSEIHLPEHASERLRDRETLWNELEWKESNKKAQLAHSFDITFMNEFSMEENIELARRFVEEQLVARGMIVDLAVHDPKRPDDKEPNPHMHIMVPIRPLKADGTWDIKQKKIPIINEDGTPVLNKDGKPKMKAVPVTDWSTKETLIELRKAWAQMCNELYEEKGLVERVDWRSYEAQGVNLIPTIHEGPAVRAMEARGIETALGAMNRMIRKFNQMLREAKELLARAWFRESQLWDKMTYTRKPTIAEYLLQYYDQRNAVADTFAYGSQKAKMTNFKELTSTIAFLQNEHIETPDELTARIADLQERIQAKKDVIAEKTFALKLAKDGIRAWEEYEKYKPVYDEMTHKRFRKDKYKEDHKKELSKFYMARRVLQENHNEEGKVPLRSWERDKDALPNEIEALKADRESLYEELKSFQKVQRSIDAVLSAEDHDGTEIADSIKRPVEPVQSRPSEKKNQEQGIHSALEQKKQEVRQNEAAKLKKKRSRGMEL